MSNQIKLVIWDLDDTFWSGTLAEGTAVINDAHVALVTHLNSIGVINTICSKNDAHAVDRFLKDNGLSDLFVFSVVSYDNKSKGIRHILDSLGLRPQNAVFIDDNFHNREEVLFNIPEIDVQDVDFISALSLTDRIKPGKSRIDQYRQVAARAKAQTGKSSNIEFLRSSNIIVEILPPTDVDRIEEMVSRTNQLNFTKNRHTRLALQTQISDPNNECGVIRVHDRFGDYGIVGYYCLNRTRNSVTHFLFSCRILGLGVEKFIYNHLGKPKISIRGEVVETLDSDDPIDWIKLERKESWGMIAHEKLPEFTNLKIGVRGGCDLAPIVEMLRSSGVNIHTDYGNENNQTQLRYISDAFNIDSTHKRRIIDTVPFVTEETYKSILLEKSFDFAIISLVVDYSRIFYSDPKSGAVVFHEITNGLDKLPLRDGSDDNFTHLKFSWIKNGRQSPSDLSSALEAADAVLTNVSQVIFINGAEIPGVSLSDHHHLMNQALDQFVSRNPSKYSIADVRKLAYSCEHLREADNIRHYVRSVYVGIFNSIVEIVRSKAIRQST